MMMNNFANAEFSHFYSLDESSNIIESGFEDINALSYDIYFLFSKELNYLIILPSSSLDLIYSLSIITSFGPILFFLVFVINNLQIRIILITALCVAISFVNSRIVYLIASTFAFSMAIVPSNLVFANSIRALLI